MLNGHQVAHGLRDKDVDGLKGVLAKLPPLAGDLGH